MLAAENTDILSTSNSPISCVDLRLTAPIMLPLNVWSLNSVEIIPLH